MDEDDDKTELPRVGVLSPASRPELVGLYGLPLGDESPLRRRIERLPCQPSTDRSPPPAARPWWR